ncbi:MAG: methylenetetrahydrofolate reductase, partial [Gammaproteobacteria bacterium]|nr:methylenetetrahydrofolate reductase [Gammaproteobacteria bacterium]
MKTNDPIYSFEFFPPKTAEGMSMLEATSQALAALKPGFFSVTF